MNYKTKIIVLLTVCLLLFFVADLASAQGLVRCGQVVDGKLQECTIKELIFTLIRIINFFIGAAWMFALFFIFWGSYGMATSYGNSEKIEAGKKTVQEAFIGFFLIMVAFILINFVFIALTGYSLKETINFLPIQ